MENIPAAMGLIPDGNRRWAKKHNKTFYEAYETGVKKFIDFSEWAKDLGIKNITVWAFSTENFKRPLPEKRAVFSIYQKMANDETIIKRLHENRTRLNIIGNLSLLPKRLLESLKSVEEQTSKYRERVINMLIAYGGRDDILHAAKELIKRSSQNRIRSINTNIFKRFMFSAEIPDMDLIIRTSGEERLSGFLPWQTCYSELYFSKKLWPDFTKQDLTLAIKEYSIRQRRFGR